MYGLGILKGMGITLKHFLDTYIDDIRFLGKGKRTDAAFHLRQSGKNRGLGLFTVEYPEEKIAVPERFRFTPFLVINNLDAEEAPGKDWCTSCGICAKVCPPQCIWIVRGTNPETGRPVPEPAEFYIYIDICMNCGFCAEFCPFDAIRMDHDYEVASVDRIAHHIFDLNRLLKPASYYASIRPTNAAREDEARAAKAAAKKPGAETAA